MPQTFTESKQSESFPVFGLAQFNTTSPDVNVTNLKFQHLKHRNTLYIVATERNVFGLAQFNIDWQRPWHCLVSPLLKQKTRMSMFSTPTRHTEGLCIAPSWQESGFLSFHVAGASTTSLDINVTELNSRPQNIGICYYMLPRHATRVFFFTNISNGQEP